MKEHNLETSIFSYILKEKKTTTLAIVRVFGEKGFTKQGVYKVLRALLAQEKILWVKTHIEVHLLWVHKEIETLAKTLPRKEIIFQEFSTTKKMYRVKTLTELEQVYGQIFISLIASLHNEVRDFLFYDIHNYTYINTVSVVDWYIDFITKHKGRTYLLVGSTSPLDMALKRKNKMKMIDVHCVEKKWNVNLSIFGDYIITVTTNKRIVEKMDTIFQTKNENSARKPIEDLYKEKSLYKIMVEKNQSKANEIKKEFKKYFHIK